MVTRSPRSRPGRGPVAGSAALHVAAVAVAVVTQAGFESSADYEVYRIELVSPPVTELVEESAPPQEELVVETPQPEPEEAAPPLPEPEREREPEVERSEPVREVTEPPTAEARPEAEPAEESGLDIQVRMEGLRRDYPAYYANIIRQIGRCFRWQGTGNPSATVRFTINRDGSVDELRIFRRSGNPGFDFEAMGAVECAGSGGRFGTLPEDLPYDRLPVEFTFEPTRRQELESTSGVAR